MAASGSASRRGSTTHLSSRNSSPRVAMSHRRAGSGAADTTMSDAISERDEDEGEEAASGASSFLDKVPLLDIAFLHGIASHRPLGPHKHFNIVPVLLHMERTVQRLGPRLHAHIRSGGRKDGYDDSDDESADEGAEGGIAHVKVKRENDIHDAGAEAIYVDADMIWQRLHELYDVEGLDELEDGAIDGDEHSPFSTNPQPSLATRAARKLFASNRASPPAAFGFGNGLVRIDGEVPAKETAPAKTSTKRAVSSTKKGRPASESSSDSGDEEAAFTDFELGPWEDYEELIAPRRKKGYSDSQADSDSEAELSSPMTDEVAVKSKPPASSRARQQTKELDTQSAATSNASRKRRRSEKAGDDEATSDAVKEENEGSDDESSASEEDEDDGETHDGEDDDDDAGEEEDEAGEKQEKRPVKRSRQSTSTSVQQTPAARRSAAASSATPASARSKRGAGAASSSTRASPSPVATASRGTRSTAPSASKPRRSGRR